MNTPETIIKEITGKVVKLKLIKGRGDEELFFVKKGEEESFKCKTRSPGFKGGVVTATIS